MKFYPMNPWQRLHINYRGPFVGHYYYSTVNVSTYSYYTFETNSCSVGIPEILVPDNFSSLYAMVYNYYTILYILKILYYKYITTILFESKWYSFHKWNFGFP